MRVLDEEIYEKEQRILRSNRRLVVEPRVLLRKLEVTTRPPAAGGVSSSTTGPSSGFPMACARELWRHAILRSILRFMVQRSTAQVVRTQRSGCQSATILSQRAMPP